MEKEVLEGFRLSPQQTRLWHLQQSDGSPAYKAQCAVLIEGDLKIEILRKALERIVHHHEILRTSFLRLSGMAIPVQIISDHGTVTIEEDELSGCADEEEISKSILFWLRQESNHPT